MRISSESSSDDSSIADEYSPSENFEEIMLGNEDNEKLAPFGENVSFEITSKHF